MSGGDTSLKFFYNFVVGLTVALPRSNDGSVALHKSVVAVVVVKFRTNSSFRALVRGRPTFLCGLTTRCVVQ